MASDLPATDEFDGWLAELGAGPRALSDAEREALDRDGYVTLRDAVPPWLVRELLRRLEGVRAGTVRGKRVVEDEGEESCRRIDGVLGVHADFHACWTNRRLLAAVRHLLGEPFAPVSLDYRAPLLGSARQPMRRDAPYHGHAPMRGYAHSIVALVPFTADAGATRVVPGSHREDRLPCEVMRDVAGPHPSEIALEGPAGTIFVLDGNCWHAGGRNDTAIPRHALRATWMARRLAHPAPLAQRETIPAEILSAIGPAAAAVLGWSSLAV